MPKLANGIVQLNLGKANSYLIAGPDGFTLVDAVTQGSLPALERAAQRAGHRLRDIKRIIATHAHVDHVGGLAEVKAFTGAEVWAHRLDAPFIRRGDHPPYPAATQLRSMDRLLGTLVDWGIGRAQPPATVERELEDGEPLGAALPGWEVIHLPGHTPGHIGLWWSQHGVLLGGDVVMHLTPWLTAPLAAYTTDAASARVSIGRAAALKPQILAVGHGTALAGHAATALRRLVIRLK